MILKRFKKSKALSTIIVLTLLFANVVAVNPAFGTGIAQSSVSNQINKITTAEGGKTATFDKKTPKDITVKISVYNKSITLSKITNGETVVNTAYYAVKGTTVTIKKDYLSKQPVGTTSLTFDFSAGTDPVLDIDVKDTSEVNTLVAKTTTFDKKTAKDITVKMSAYNKSVTLSKIKNGDTVVNTAYYAVKGTTVTIKKDYLSKQPVGKTSLTFDFSAGTDPVL
ncbi:MAG: X2-like carbohydrate binding domain-containing protein, partial [Desulfitobacteriaceae bacterium]